MYIQSFIKIVIAIFLFVCLLNMPYGYYQLVRFIAFIIFGIFAYQSYMQGKQMAMVVYGALALLFQPFWKIALGRELWNIVDVLVGIGLIISIFVKKK